MLHQNPLIPAQRHMCIDFTEVLRSWKFPLLYLARCLIFLILFKGRCKSDFSSKCRTVTEGPFYIYLCISIVASVLHVLKITHSCRRYTSIIFKFIELPINQIDLLSTHAEVKDMFYSK